jgi:ABC-type branched-subunit amino acid transport system ATPase component
MTNLITISPGFAFSYSGNENNVVHIPEESLPITIEDGSIYGIQGPNGSGKTTLMNLLNGFLRPTQGTITYNGNNSFIISNKSYIENGTVLKVANFNTGIRRLFQVPILSDDLSILESVLLVKREKRSESFMNYLNPVEMYLRLTGKETESEKAISLLKEFDFDDPNISTATLSYGQRRIITLLQMLFSEATLLLLDEPFANIHDDNVKKMKNHLKLFIKGFNRSIIIIEHNNNNIKDFVDILWTLSDKNIIVSESRC